MPSRTLRGYFYGFPNAAESKPRPRLYEKLRIPATASPADLRVAFKLRNLELAGAQGLIRSLSNGLSKFSPSRNCVPAITLLADMGKRRRCFPTVDLARCSSLLASAHAMGRRFSLIWHSPRTKVPKISLKFSAIVSCWVLLASLCFGARKDDTNLKSLYDRH